MEVRMIGGSLMDSAKKEVILVSNDNNRFKADLVIYEEAPEDEEMVLLELNINGEIHKYKSDNCYSALQDMRVHLEEQGIRVLCNGAARNVYPSPMQQSMGVGRMAYKNYLGQQARMKDVVDIFDYDEGLDFVVIDEQAKFHDEWLKSL
jgi:hypothetical protein